MIFKGLPLYLYQLDATISSKVIKIDNIQLQSESTLRVTGAGAIFQLSSIWKGQGHVAYELVRLNDYVRIILTEEDLETCFELIDNPLVIETIEKKKEECYRLNDMSVMVTSDVY